MKLHERVRQNNYGRFNEMMFDMSASEEDAYMVEKNTSYKWGFEDVRSSRSNCGLGESPLSVTVTCFICLSMPEPLLHLPSFLFVLCLMASHDENTNWHQFTRCLHVCLCLLRPLISSTTSRETLDCSSSDTLLKSVHVYEDCMIS